ncbi:MAG TPA: hypothetical protein VFM88_23710 [Vicinamibacteria bacterium]|nr:hypothetical protein [Vicinamibacteria bacterium]
MLFGGASRFWAKQDLITSVSFTSNLNSNDLAWTISNVQAVQTAEEQSGLGLHSGIDVAFMFIRHLGMGMELRYSKAIGEFHTSLLDDVPSSASLTPTDIHLGGLQIGAGIRMEF